MTDSIEFKSKINLYRSIDEYGFREMDSLKKSDIKLLISETYKLVDDEWWWLVRLENNKYALLSCEEYQYIGWNTPVVTLIGKLENDPIKVFEDVPDYHLIRTIDFNKKMKEMFMKDVELWNKLKTIPN